MDIGRAREPVAVLLPAGKNDLRAVGRPRRLERRNPRHSEPGRHAPRLASAGVDHKDLEAAQEADVAAVRGPRGQIPFDECPHGARLHVDDGDPAQAVLVREATRVGRPGRPFAGVDDGASVAAVDVHHVDAATTASPTRGVERDSPTVG